MKVFPNPRPTRLCKRDLAYHTPRPSLIIESMLHPPLLFTRLSPLRITFDIVELQGVFWVLIPAGLNIIV